MVDEVKTKILSQFPFLTEEFPFFEQLSSIELVELVSYIEDSFAVQVHALEYSPQLLENFQSIAALIEKKRSL